VSEGHARLQPGSLTRNFSYVFVDNEPPILTPKVRTDVNQEQVLLLMDDGRLQLRITETMPGLPAGRRSTGMPKQCCICQHTPYKSVCY
jgi:hypothetical protein